MANTSAFLPQFFRYFRGTSHISYFFRLFLKFSRWRKKVETASCTSQSRAANGEDALDREAAIELQRRRLQANDALELFHQRADEALCRRMDLELREFLRTKGIRDLPAATFSKDRREIPRGDNDKIRAEIAFVEEKLAAIVQAKGQTELALEISRLLRPLRKTPTDTPAPDNAATIASTSNGTERSREQANTAIKYLFDMERRTQFTVGDALGGEYFGYRRSANQGEIIRFYMKMWRDPDDGILRFMNRLRDGHAWQTKGFGFEVDGIVNLLGHAISETGPRTGMGLRCFSLSKYEHFDWVVGLILSTDRRKAPIGARVVSIPAEQHPSYSSIPKADEEKRRSEMLRMIENRVTLKQIKQQVKFEDVDKLDAFRTVPCSTHVQSLIWNGSITTLHGHAEAPTRDEIPAYKALQHYHRLAIAKVRAAGSPMQPILKAVTGLRRGLPKEELDDE